MKRPTNTKEYSKLNIQELLNIVSTDFHTGMKETFETVNQQLGIAHKLEPNDEELEFSLVTLKKMQSFFFEHIAKEQQLLFPLFSLKAQKSNQPISAAEIRDFVSQLKVEHDDLKRDIQQLKKITNDYRCDASVTPSHKLAFAQLEDLEQDFNRLFFVEEEFLFPRVLRIHNQ